MLESKDHQQILRSSGALDLRFALRARGWVGSECQIRSTSAAARGRNSMTNLKWQRLYVIAALVLAAGSGFGTGYIVWEWPANWYAGHDLTKLPPGPESDLIRYGWQLIADTPRNIGKSASDPANRYAGNDLACTHCHINSGLKPFAAPLRVISDDGERSGADAQRSHQRLHDAEYERRSDAR